MTKTLVLINNFIASTSVFFNNFTEVIEDKISKLSNKITDVEILLAVLEAKLNSIPGLDHIEAAKAPAPATSNASSSNPSSSNTSAHSTAASPAPASAPVNANTPQSTESTTAAAAAQPSNEASAPAAEEEAPKPPSLADDPDYGPFFRLLKVGVPLFVVQAKAAAAGLDPSAFENFTP